MDTLAQDGGECSICLDDMVPGECTRRLLISGTLLECNTSSYETCIVALQEMRLQDFLVSASTMSSEQTSDLTLT